MSYLLTEIAMEMLGWQFYDTDGVARPINLEALNIATSEDADPLKKALNIQFVESFNSVKAEADSSSIEAMNEGQDMEEDSPLNLFSNEPTRERNTISETGYSIANDPIIKENNSKWNIDASGATDKPFMQIQSVVGGVEFEMPTNSSEELTCESCSTNDYEMPSNETLEQTALIPVPIAIHANPMQVKTGFQTSFTDMIDQYTTESVFTQVNAKNFSESSIACEPTTSKSSSKWNNISISKMTLSQPDKKSNAHLSAVGNKSQTQSYTDFEVQQMLESELFKVALDVNREKSRFYKSLNIDPTTKTNGPVLRKATERYRAQELDNLKQEVKNLYELRLKTEHLCITKFPKTYHKYLALSNTLSNNDLLQQTALTIPINSNTINARSMVSNVKKT